MNRRQALLAGIALLLPASILKITGYQLERKKQFRINNGSKKVIYFADSLHMNLSDGTKAEAWVDPNNDLNIAGIEFDNYDNYYNRGYITEEFSRKIFFNN